MSYKLFLDDVRNPISVAGYMQSRIGEDSYKYLDSWVILTNYEQFKNYITRFGVPELISFDHDLDDNHDQSNSVEEKTGYDCALWLKEYCEENKIPLPKYFIHSMNPAGAERIKNVLNDFKIK